MDQDRRQQARESARLSGVFKLLDVRLLTAEVTSHVISERRAGNRSYIISQN